MGEEERKGTQCDIPERQISDLLDVGTQNANEVQQRNWNSCSSGHMQQM